MNLMLFSSCVLINVFIFVKCNLQSPIEIKFLPVQNFSPEVQEGCITIQASLGVTVEKCIEDLKKFGQFSLSEEKIRKIYKNAIEPTPSTSRCTNLDTTDSCPADDSITDNILIDQVKKLMEERRDWSTFEIADRLSLCVERTVKILGKAKYKLVDTIWVTKKLNNTQLLARQNAAIKNLNFNTDYPNGLNISFAIDEMLLQSYMPTETPSEWRRPGEKPPIRARISQMISE